jgi:spermidine synthase
MVVALLAQPTVLLIDLIPRVFFLEPGETISLSITVIATFVSLFPIGLALGVQFPLSVAYLKGNGPAAYGAEAAGAFIGGLLFTFLLAGRISPFALASVLSVLNLLVAAALYRKKILFLLAFPLALYFVAGSPASPLTEKGMILIQKTESRYGEIAVFQDGDQLNVYASGSFRYAYPDPPSEEMKVHLPLSLHDAPKQVLVIGGSPAVLREILKYPVSGVDFIETDPAMSKVSLGILSSEDRKVVKDARVKIVNVDGRRFIKSLRSPRYDLVLLNLPEPSTALVNRFYTVEFFREIKAAMQAKGILCLSIPVSHGYIGRRMLLANGSLYGSLHAVFSHIETTSEEYGGLYASDEELPLDPDALADRFVSRNVSARYFYPLLFRDIFDPLKTAMVKNRLERDFKLNTDKQPVAYLYNLMVWADVYGGRMLNTILDLGPKKITGAVNAVLLLTMTMLWGKEPAVGYSVFTGGSAFMALSMILLLAFQAAFGYVYESVGLISALFMAGLALGARLAPARPALWWLRNMDVITLMVLAAAPLFLHNEYLYYMLSMIAGIAGGMQFSIAMRQRDGAVRTAAVLYALDLAGSVAGALLTAVFLMPLLGVGRSLLVLIMMKASSLVLLFSLKREQRL